ncbi:hypothetical protein I4U23_007691 [Adineta vaga]|nr:hypothetical protein I4U23_007691 [Adineta vaga]
MSGLFATMKKRFHIKDFETSNQLTTVILGAPAYSRPSGPTLTQTSKSLGPIDTNGTGEISNQTNLIGKTILLNDQQCCIKGKFLCGTENLYALESERPIRGYSGHCPKCNQMHVVFNNANRGFYASVTSIHDHVQKQKLNNERLKGRITTDQLPTVKNNLPPLDQPILGKNKGIEGDSNSCYMDATIFCMFAYNDIFDSLLHMDVRSTEVQKLQTILRENIVYVLRDKNNGFVKLGDALFHLRAQLSEATHDSSFKEMENDPSEFLRSFEQLFSFSPLKTIVPDQSPKPDGSNITTNIIWEMFDANPFNLPSTNIASIFRNSLSEIPAKLAMIPPFLVLMSPRRTLSQRSYRYIIPDRQITLDNDIVQLVCLRCNETNHDKTTPSDFFFCSDCYSKESNIRPTTEATIVCYCNKCLRKDLHPSSSSDTWHSHDLRKIDIKKHKLNLFAVLCIETSYYVAFVRCQNRSVQQHQWLFFDSMSDRKYDEQNIPLVDRVPDFEQWIDDAERDTDHFFTSLDDRRRQARPTSQKFDEHGMRQLRLFRDGAFFFYENPNEDGRQ